MAATLTVGCKLPTGLILRLFDMVDHDEPVMGGGTKTVKRARQRSDTVTIKGCAVPFGVPPTHIVGGYGLTHGVDADFWAAWLEQNKDSEIVTKGLIFADPKADAVTGKAREREKVKSGLEPIDPSNLPKGIQGNKAA